MNDSGICPVNYKRIDAQLIKFYSIIVAALLIMFILAGWRLPLYLLTLDFILRVLAGAAYSPLCILLGGVLQFFRVCPQPVNAGTKQFAAFIGMLFLILISVLDLNGHTGAARGVAIFLLLVMLAEIMAGFCLACRVYTLYHRWFPRKKGGLM